MKLLLSFILALAAAQASAVITVQDDQGNPVVLQQPARRVVTLAAHVTELVYAAGGGDKIVGTVTYSDYPPAAQDIPRVGSNKHVDLERIVALKPDLLVIWRHNAADRQIEALRKLGIPMFYSEPNRLEEIPDAVEVIGKLLGTEKQAKQQADELRGQIARLHAQYRNRPLVRVFYQVWDKPLYTLNGKHIVSDVIRLCGGENIFGKLTLTALTVTVESVLLEKPDAIIAGANRERGAGVLDHWRQYPNLPAVRNNHLFAVEADLLNRPGPRILAGAAAVCEKLEQARRKGERP